MERFGETTLHPSLKLQKTVSIKKTMEFDYLAGQYDSLITLTARGNLVPTEGSRVGRAEKGRIMESREVPLTPS